MRFPDEWLPLLPQGSKQNPAYRLTSFSFCFFLNLVSLG